MPFYQGQRISTQAQLLNGIDSRRLFNKDGKVHELDPRQTPLLTMLMSEAGRIQLTDPEFSWLESQPYWTDKYAFFAGGAGGTSISAANAGTTTTLVVEKTVNGNDNVGFLKVGQTVRVVDAGDKTKEAILLVSTVTNQQSITLTLISPSPGFDIADGDAIYMVATAYAEGSAKTSATNDTLLTKWGSTQIFKQLVSISNTLLKTKLAGGDELYRLKANALKVLWTDLERALIFGYRGVGTTGTDPYATISTTSSGTAPTRYTAGIRQCITWANTNGYLAGYNKFANSMATYTYGALVDDLEKAFYFGSKEKIALCGRGVLSYFQKLALSESMLNLTQRESTLGFSIVDVETIHGVLKLVAHPLFINQDAYSMALLDMDNVKLAMFRELELRENVETPGTDGKEDQWLIDAGLMFTLPETGSWWTFTA